ncbi:MAG: polyketide synthase dehydratase domain-containing protein, partial [Oscillospiraceae bacterium]|nr:polyketide synthase dehydratase domain-containing protein [Oscillospiraceae bacterium]
MLNLNLNLNLNDLSLLGGKDPIPSQQEQHGVAVIGMDVKAGAALNKEAVWQAFCEGLDMITELPEKRALDARDYARRVYGRDIQNFSHRAYLPEIDGFEPELFKLSHREAELMDPVQRLYLESAWCALEDAGYGGNRLSGSKTGVYVGYNQVGESYESLLKDIPQESLGISLSGNVTSFLASRISYLLDLTGPAMVIDTACSSSLVALHLACKALRSKEIDQAIVGSIRIFFCPEKTGEDIGTTSSSDRTKSFDASADGTGGGEGIISLVLKPLRAAVRDRDHIYGVIKGSCANQDGSSIGITAPNSAAQEKAILQAWSEAQIDPEKISYIEAHGTATRLGDPVEIGGLTAAFSHYTQRRQFCALGASKSNFGHLDCCSGLLGVVKVLLMMEHRMIPPSLHFCAPNLKIDYTNSPIYMNDSLKPWTTEDGVLTAGVSSFGLSGTNCHVVLQSYDAANEPMTLELTHELLTVSARTKSSLRSYLLGLQDYLRNHGDLSLRNVCYSLNVGRSQQRCRFAIVLRDIEEFLCLSEEELFSSSRYSEHRLVSMETDEVGLLSISKQKNLTEEAKSALLLNDLDGIAKAYLQGADVSFSALYDHLPVRIVSLPTYAFSKQRCWFEGQRDYVSRVAETKAIHPLLDRCITDSYGLRVYEKRMSLQTCMELREHRIQGICVLPGTVYVEIANEIGKRHFGQTAFRFQSVTFFSLLTCNEKEERVLHCIAKEDGNSLHITIASCGDDGQWLQHIEATLCRGLLSPSEPVDLAEVLSSYPQVLTQQQDDAHEFVQLGQHWQTGLKIYASENSVILYSEVPEAFRTEASVYDLYPPLLDGSMNSGILLLEGKYLPLNYKNMQFYSPLRGSTYSRITRLAHRESNDEIALFHVELFDPQGRLIGEVEEYALKRINDAEHFLRMPQEEQSMYQICWEQQTESIQPISAPSKLTAVVLLRPEQQNSSIVSQFRNRFRNVILFMLSDRYFRETDSCIYITNQEQDMRQAVLTLGDLKSVLFINLLAFCEDPADLHAGVELKLLTAFHFIKALSGFAGKKSLCMITQNAIAVNGEEKFYAPLNQALIGFCSCIESEQSDMEISVIDTDPDTSAAVLAEAVCANQVKYIHAFRRNQLYLERISNDIPVPDPIKICDSDVIVIPGGYGGIGLAICDALFRMAPHAR